jgi:AAA domain
MRSSLRWQRKPADPKSNRRFVQVLSRHSPLATRIFFPLLEPVTAHNPTLVFIVGPPAVGKMTVGHELAARTGFKLFHNHHTIDLVLRFFPFGSPPFNRLVGEFRRRIFEEIAGSDLLGVIFTYVWAFNIPADEAAVNQYAEIFRSRGGRVVVVELETSQEERLRRNETEFRLAEKPFKRDLAASRRQLLELDDKYQLNSHGRLAGREDYLHLDNTSLSPAEAAERIVQAFGLDRVLS